ncbi:hypothetical protein B484DRAFT_473344 [Ochromonadaceae sp. CCMP2298]|nr:hypothetical protein B484DRAFT_473344 [Ochromonadaceae sp. CCMP2298]
MLYIIHNICYVIWYMCYVICDMVYALGADTATGTVRVNRCMGVWVNGCLGNELSEEEKESYSIKNLNRILLYLIDILLLFYSITLLLYYSIIDNNLSEEERERMLDQHDPYDPTEAWQVYSKLAAVSRSFARRDDDFSGIVELPEYLAAEERDRQIEAKKVDLSE